jgi:hypothetical protein
VCVPINRLGGDGDALPLRDVIDPAETRRLLELTMESFGKLDPVRPRRPYVDAF